MSNGFTNPRLNCAYGQSYTTLTRRTNIADVSSEATKMKLTILKFEDTHSLIRITQFRR